MSLLLAAPYLGLLAGLIGAGVYLYLWRTTVPVAACGWRGSKVAMGDCPTPDCSGSTHMVSQASHATLWKCDNCSTTWMLSTVPGE